MIILSKSISIAKVVSLDGTNGRDFKGLLLTTGTNGFGSTWLIAPDNFGIALSTRREQGKHTGRLTMQPW